jgi:hypothetical protein
MSAIWESANWTRQFGIRQTENRQFGMLPNQHPSLFSAKDDCVHNSEGSIN